MLSVPDLNQAAEILRKLH